MFNFEKKGMKCNKISGKYNIYFKNYKLDYRLFKRLWNQIFKYLLLIDRAAKVLELRDNLYRFLFIFLFWKHGKPMRRNVVRLCSLSRKAGVCIIRLSYNLDRIITLSSRLKMSLMCQKYKSNKCIILTFLLHGIQEGFVQICTRVQINRMRN